MTNWNRIIKIVLVTLLAAYPIAALAETLSGTNYNIENPSIDSGGQQSSSTNYTESESMGGSNDSGSSSTNYKIFPGFVQHAYPGVPNAPTFTNTGGVMYNALNFVVVPGPNATNDTYFAIAISSDNFVTTNFIQADDTIGSSPAWQKYVDWGSSTGQTVTGLAGNTTYKIKVKARFAADTETGYSQTASATTSGASISVSFAGVSSGTTVAGATTTITSLANSIAYGSLTPNVTAVAAQTITVTTNATGGYTTTIEQDGNLRKNNGDNISPVSGSNSSPTTWPTSITNGYFGYHTTDSLLCTGTTNRFSTNDTYAAATSTPSEISCNTGPVSSEQTTVVYKVEIGTNQPSGDYQNTITYVTTAQY